MFLYLLQSIVVISIFLLDHVPKQTYGIYMNKIMQNFKAHPWINLFTVSVKFSF